MSVPRPNSILGRVFQALYKHMGEFVEIGVLLEEINDGKSEDISSWVFESRVSALRMRGYKIEVDPPSAPRHFQEKAKRRYKLIDIETTLPKLDSNIPSRWLVGVSFKDINKARDFAKDLRSVLDREVEILGI